MKWSAGWGSACDPCAKAKTRCIRPQDGSDAKCNRCQSLNVSCVQQIRKPRKKRRRQTEADAIPGVSQHHNSTVNGSTDFNSSRGPPLPSGEPVSIGEALPKDPSQSELSAHATPVKIEPTGAFKAASWLPGYHPFPNATCTCPADPEAKDGSRVPESDESLLAIYRTRLSPQFPFVIIPDGVTAADLHKSRPFLAKAIRMVASLRSRQLMWEQSKSLLREISETVFLGTGRSLDLLQGVLVFLGFYHYFCFAHGHFNTLAHLASSIVADMKLDRPRIMPVVRKKYPAGIDPAEPKAMSNDERRAILGVWFIGSSSAVSYEKVNSPGGHFTQLMERLVQELQQEHEYQTDEVLVQLICAQRINEMVAQLQQSNQTVDIQPSSTMWAAKVDQLLAELQNLRVAVSENKAHHYSVSSHHHFALLQLLGPQLVESNRFRNYEPIAALQNTPSYFRSASKDSSAAADKALREWFEVWLTIPVCHFFYMPTSGYLQLMNATVILLRRSRLALLARCRHKDTNPSDMGLNKDGNPSMPGDAGPRSDDLMLGLLDRLASRFEEARIEMAAAHCSDWNNDYLDILAWKLRERKQCIEKWVDIIASEAQGNALLHDEAGTTSHRRAPGGPSGGDESALAAFQNMDESALWLDPLETLLLGDEMYPYESWL